jgi:hypothetical protein
VILQRFVQGENIRFPILIVYTHTIGITLALAGILVRKLQILYRDYLLKQMTYAFHSLLFLYGVFDWHQGHLPTPFRKHCFSPRGEVSIR